jgi:hypothetical protein
MRLATERPIENIDPAKWSREQVADILGNIMRALIDYGEVTIETGTLESGAILSAWHSYLPKSGAL